MFTGEIHLKVIRNDYLYCIKNFRMKRLLVCLYIGLLFAVPASFSQNYSLKAKETPALFPGGLDSLYLILEQNFRISRTDLQFQQHEDLIGDVRLTISKKGEVVNVTGGPTRIEYELERALLSLPPFIPATNQGNPVTSYVELKFMFFIKGNRMEIVEHISDHQYTRTKDTGWLKATMAAAAIVLFLILWGG